MLKHRFAYYEACGKMLNESEHRAKFSQIFDFSDLLKDPTPEDFKKECMGQKMEEQQLSDDDGNKGGIMDEEDNFDVDDKCG